MTTDFEIGRDEYGQRVVWPSSEAGYEFFRAHIADFDLSEQGWELDTTHTAYSEFVSAMNTADLTFEEVAAQRVDSH